MLGKREIAERRATLGKDVYNLAWALSTPSRVRRLGHSIMHRNSLLIPVIGEERTLSYSQGVVQRDDRAVKVATQLEVSESRRGINVQLRAVTFENSPVDPMGPERRVEMPLIKAVGIYPSCNGQMLGDLMTPWRANPDTGVEWGTVEDPDDANWEPMHEILLKVTRDQSRQNSRQSPTGEYMGLGDSGTSSGIVRLSSTGGGGGAS